MKMDDLELTIGTANALRNAGITYVSQFLKMSADEIASIPNLGTKRLAELIKEILIINNGEILASAKKFEEWKINNSFRADSLAIKAKKYDQIAEIVNSKKTNKQ